MKYCPNCGCALADGAKFCARCGTKQHSGDSVREDAGAFTTAEDMAFTAYGIPADAIPPEITDIRPLNETGGFALLFRGFKTDLGIPVVIKRALQEFRGKLDDTAEARILTQLRHTYLPRVYAMRTASDGFTYTVMDFIEGDTLRHYIEYYGRIGRKLAYKWTCQLCQVIGYMHSGAPVSIIHSDLKPENVMITPEGNICVIDFNASLEVTDPDKILTGIGASAGYAAPEQYNVPLSQLAPDSPAYPFAEQAQGMGHIGRTTDLYAIGALAYYMLTGHDPAPWFMGIVPMEQYRAQAGDAFETFIRKAMQPRQKDRYASAEEMLRVLERLPKLSQAYRARTARIWALYIALLAGLAAGIFCIQYGLLTLQDEHEAHYEALVNEGDRLRVSGRFSEAQESLQEAVSYDSTRVEAYTELGALLYQRGEYQEAIDLLTEGSFGSAGRTYQAYGDSIGRFYYVLGSCYYEIQEYDRAVDAYEQAVYFMPEDIPSQRDFAIACAADGDMDGAYDAIETLEELDCPEADLAMVSGEIEFADGRYEEACEDLVTAAEGSEDQAAKSRSYLQAARACDALGADWAQRKIEILEGARSDLDDTHRTQVLQMLAESYMGMAQGSADAENLYERALECLNEVEEGGLETLTTRLNHALCEQYLGQFDAAMEELQDLSEEYPDDYRIPMRQAFLCIQIENGKDIASRDYTDFRSAYEEAERLYRSANTQDTEMMNLESLAADVEAKGW